MSKGIGSSPNNQSSTSEWNGERFEDGRPKIAHDLLERLNNNFGKSLAEELAMTGRAVKF